MLHNIWRYTVNLDIVPDDRLSLLQAPHFSGAVSSFFCAVLNGASSHPYDVRRLGFVGIPAWLRSHEITIYHSVPAIFREVITAGGFPALRCVRLEGDRASHQDIVLFRRHCHPGTMLANGLGATECGLVRQWRIDRHTAIAEGPVPIGTAIEDMQTLLLAEDGTEVAPGQIGEIAIRSHYLALGYWRDPELTAARFGTTCATPSARTYRTGDLGRFVSPGLLVYLGRKDFSVKAGGQWFDSYAVEEALSQFDEINDAVVAVRNSGSGQHSVVAYVVLRASGTLNVATLRTHLATLLPEAMIPASYIVLDRLPLDVNNKVDRSALPPPPANASSARSADAPPNSVLEDQLLAICKDILGVQAMGIHDNFFELGGDSLAIMRIVSRLKGVLALDPPLTIFFAHPTIAGVAAELRGLARTTVR